MSRMSDHQVVPSVWSPMIVWTDDERDALRRCRSFVAGNAFGVPVEAQEQHLEYLLAALAPHVAQREREAATQAWAVGWRAGTTGATPTVNPYRDEVTS